MSNLDPNTVQYHLLDTIKFLIWAMVILGSIHLAGLSFYDRLLRKKAWLARQRQAFKRFRSLLIKRRLERFKRGPLSV